jgi:hypothetical protein
MSHTPNYDARVASILDQTSPGERACKLTGEKWNLQPQEIDLYRKYNVPPVDVSPNTQWKWMGYYDCGFQFWWNKHAETGKPVLSFHHPASGVRVLPDKEWHEKDFSAITEPYDANRPFFDQLRALELKVPLLATFSRVEPENSITLFSFGDRNSYFTFACKSERTFFASGAFDVRDSSLLWLGMNISESHATQHSHRLHRCKYIRESLDCIDSAFLFDCRNCQNCFGATNKRNRQYVFMNEQLSKEEYERRVASIDLGRRSVLEEWQRTFDDLLLSQGVFPENFNVNCQDSTGEYLVNAVRCTECFDSNGAPTDNWHCGWMYGSSQGNMHGWGVVDNQECYQTVSCPNSNRTKFSYRSFRLDNCEYCMMCSDLQDCFGCIGLKKKRFCILNAQYTEEEYWKTLDEIKCRLLDTGEYGHYLPVTLSSTYVPESGAVSYAGATPEELKQIGGNLFEPTADGATGAERITTTPRNASDVPDSIDDVTDEWAGVPIFDPEAKRTFSFLKPVLDHYRALRIAPPTRHFVQRFNSFSLLGQVAAFETRSCDSCKKSITVAQNRSYPNRRILCNVCYLAFLEQNG